MRIGIDCRLWKETGVGRYIQNLIKNLNQIDKKNQYVLFVLSKDEKAIKSQITNPKFKMTRADIRWHSIDEQRNFTTIIEKEELDLMHFPYFSVPISYKRPYVVTIHDLILHHFPTGEASTLPLPLYWLKLSGYRYVIKQAAKNAKKILTVSNATKKEILDHLGVKENSVVVIYEGVEPRLIKTISKRVVTAPYFLHVGNLYPHKNMKRLVDAFMMHHLANPTVKLVIVGKKDYFYESFAKFVAQRGASDNIIFFNNVGDDELAGLYQHSIAVVVPSLMEGFGLPAIEAMANRCIVVASDIPSLKEVCGEAAIYFNPKNTNDIAKGLEIAHGLSKDQLIERTERGLAIVKNYSWEKMAEQTLSVYNSLI